MLGVGIKSQKERDNKKFQGEFSRSVAGQGMKATLRDMKEHNDKVDASKERERKTHVENQVSNQWLSGIHGTTHSSGVTLERFSHPFWQKIKKFLCRIGVLEYDFEKHQKRAGKRRYVWDEKLHKLVEIT